MPAPGAPKKRLHHSMYHDRLIDAMPSGSNLFSIKTAYDRILPILGLLVNKSEDKNLAPKIRVQSVDFGLELSFLLKKHVSKLEIIPDDSDSVKQSVANFYQSEFQRIESEQGEERAALSGDEQPDIFSDFGKRRLKLKEIDVIYDKYASWYKKYHSKKL